MLTHHLQDPNCDAAQLIKSGAMSLNALSSGKAFALMSGIGGKIPEHLLQLTEAVCERQRQQQAKGMSMGNDGLTEFSRLMEKNNGQLFKIESGYSKDDQKSGGYFSDDDFSTVPGTALGDRLPNGDRPIFKIRIKPRGSRCQMHSALLLKYHA
jgi:hypothetical protein